MQETRPAPGSWAASRCSTCHGALRGKRRATLDRCDDGDREAFLALARRADVVIESFGPGVAAKLGIDHASLLATNPRLIHCSITGYGETGKHVQRPAYD